MPRLSWIRRLVNRSLLKTPRTIRHTLRTEQLEKRLAPAWLGGLPLASADFDGDLRADIVTGSLPGETARVTVRAAVDGLVLQSFLPFGPAFTGGVNVAAADFTGDGIPELVVGAGPGGGPHVRVITAEGNDLFSFFAFDPAFTGGVSVAAADFDGDGKADLAVGAGPGGGPHVRVFRGTNLSELAGFFAYSPMFTGGVSLAAADVTGDGVSELITGAGVGGGPHVRVFDVATGRAVSEFFAYSPDFRGGISVATGDVDGDGRFEILMAPGAGGGPHVRIITATGVAVADLLAFPADGRAGTGIGAGDVDGDGKAEVLAGGVTIRALNASTGTTNLEFNPKIEQYGAFRVPGTSGEPLAVRLIRLDDNTDYRNEFGLYAVDDPVGRVNGLLPNAPGYAAAALTDDRVRPFFRVSGSVAEAEYALPQGGYFAFYLIQNTSATDWRLRNPLNALGTGPHAFFSFPEANPDQFGHMLRPGRQRFAFEDLTGGGDADFNDVAVAVRFPSLEGPSPPPPPPPVPTNGNFQADLSGYTRTDLGGTTGGTTVANGFATLVEGDRFRVGLSRAFTVPIVPTNIVITFDQPAFDLTSAGRMNDAFEIAVLGADGSPLALPIAVGRDAAFNWTEGFTPIGGVATTTTTGTVTLNLSALPAGTAAQLVLRLVNNDADTGTSVRIRRVDFVTTTVTAPAGVTTTGRRESSGSVNLLPLTDVTPSIVPVYGRTTLTEENTVLTADLALRNIGSYPVIGVAVVAIGNLSDPDVGVLNHDGFTADGRPYFDLSAELGNGLAPGSVTASRLVRFSNPNRERFTYDLQVLAGLNHAPTLAPLSDANATVGQTFIATATASDPDGQPLSFRLLAGPTGLTIDTTGRFLFTPQPVDVGTHLVRVQVIDSVGATAEATFTLTVVDGQPNRPPLFTSTPPTDAKVASPFEVRTYATGPNPVAVTAGNFGGGVSVVTADPSDQILRVHPGPTFGPTPLSVGEINPSRFDNNPVLRAAAVDLGFSPGTYLNVERDVYGFIATDVNRDGNPDIVASVVLGALGFDNATSGDGYIGARLGNGDGTFRAGWQVKLPAVNVGGFTYMSGTDTVRHVDVNGDGFGDLVAVQKYGGRALVYIGKGDGTFADTPVTTDSPAFVNNFQVADLNADGKPDLVRFEKNENGRFRTGTSVLFGDGTGRFGGEVVYPALDREGDGYLVDLDGKNGPDIVRLDYDGAKFNVRLNDGTGKFGPVIASDFKGGVNLFYQRPMSAQFGDFDGDGKSDIAASSTYQVDGGVFVLHGNGDGTFGNNTLAGNLELSGIQEIAAFTRGGDGVAPDLNGDGRADILFGDVATSVVVVALSDGAGGFDTQSYVGRLTADIGPVITPNEQDTPFVASADFNRDGVVDVLIGRVRGSNTAGAIGLALGDRPGTLRLPRVETTALTFETQDSLLADFTRDGIPDLFANNRFNFTVSVGRGDGTFEPARLALNTRYVDGYVLVADFDHDGANDISYLSGANQQFVQAFGLGDGTFSKMPTIPFPSQYSSGAYGDFYISGDFNSDGHTDVAYRLRNGLERRVFVLLYNPTGRRFDLIPDTTGLLTGPAFYTLTAYPDEALGYADLNGDGKAELFTHSLAVAATDTTPALPTRLTVWQTTGGNATDATTLFARTIFNTPGFGNVDAESFVVADFNRDGRPDLALGANNGTIRVGFGTGDFQFRDVVTYDAPGLADLGSGDVNGDGSIDLIANYSNTRRAGGLAGGSVYLGRPDGTFGPVQEFGGSGTDLSYTFLDGSTAADINADGRIDFAINIGGNAAVFPAVSPGLADVTRGDVNGDGRLDLVAINTGYDRVIVLHGNGQNGFDRQPVMFSGLGPVAVELGDVNGDGRADIVTANRGDRTISVLRNENGSYSRSDSKLEFRPAGLSIADLNGDGFADVVTFGEQTMTVLPGSANGLGTALTLPLGFAAKGLTLTDVTGDGKLDAVLTDPDGKRVVVLPGLGNGAFGTPTIVPLTIAPGQVAAADLNADGKMDLIVTFPGEGRIGVLFARGGGRYTTPQLISVGKTPTALAVQDVDGDGKPDLLVTNTGDGTLSVVLNRYDPANLLRYQATAIDPDGDPITFSLEAGPGGLLLDEATGMAVWAPMPEQVGDNSVVIRASDGRGGFAEQGFTVRVTTPVATIHPAFTSEPITSVPADTAYHYQPRVTVPINQPVRYSLVDGPAGMTVNPTTGEVTWDSRRNGLSLSLYRPDLNPPRFVNRGEVTVPDSPSLHTASVTAEGWFHFDNNPAGQSLTLLNKRWIQDNNPNNVQSWAITLRNGFVRAAVGNLSNPDAFVDAPVQLLANRWYHLALTFNDTTRTLTLLVDGVAIGTSVSAVPLVFSNRPLEITPQQNFIGTVAGVRVWDHDRAAAEIQADMLRDVPTNSPGLVLDLRFNEGPDAITAEDSSPFDISGSILSSNQRFDDPERVPSLATVGDYPVTLRVDDGKGGVSEQRFTIRVTSPFAVTVSGRVFDDANGNGVQDRRAIDNLIVNGDFTSGAIGFTSELAAGTYTGTGFNSQRPGVYTVGKALSALQGSNFGLEHTNRSGSALIVTALADDRVAWAQTVAVTPGQSYDFGFWANRTGTEPARLQVRVNGQLLPGVFDLATGVNHWWSRFKATWAAGTATEARIEIVLLGALGTGIVGTAIDDITFLPVGVPQAVVLGSAEVWLAGLPAGSKANGDTAPQASPVAVPGLTLTAGQTLTFTVAGGTASTATPRNYTADGVASNVSFPALNGLSGLAMPATLGMVGVFLDGSSPLGQTPPTTLNFNTGGNVPGGVDYLSLAPQLRQVFFIGDGRTSTGNVQRVTVPAGATRLFFGTLDTGTNSDNPDGFSVQVFDDAVPDLEPALANRIVYVDTDGNGRLSTGEPTAITDAAGLYSFQLAGVSAKIGLVPEVGRVQTTPTTPTSIVMLDSNQNRIDFATVRVQAGPPLFVSTPPSDFGAPGNLTYATLASSTDGSPITYRLAVAPAGAVIDPTSGLMSWSAGAGNFGMLDFLITATDGVGRVGFQQFQVNVTVNTPPVITSTPPSTASIGVPLRYDVAAQDAEQSALTFVLESGPTGLNIDPVTGRVSWTPVANDTGTQPVTILVSDGVGGVARQSFSLVVGPATINSQPVFTSGPRAAAQVGIPYRSRVTATDPDGDTLVFTLLEGPSGLTLNADGVVAWTPTNLGPAVVRVQVSDGRGGIAERSFPINVDTVPVRSVVEIISTPPANAVLGRSYAYDLVAPGAVAFELLTGPSGLSLDPIRGRVRWTPAAGQLGPVTVTVRAMDELGAADEQTWTLTVRGSVFAPAFASTPPTLAAVGQTYLYPSRANNPVGIPLNFSLITGPTGMSIDTATGDVTWNPTSNQTGRQVVSLRVGDGANNFSTQTFEIVVTAGVANRPPVASSLPPTDATIGQPLTYTFAATDPDNGAITFSVARGPAGLTIDPVTGVVSWTPADTDLGTVAVTLVARDPQGAAAVQSFQIDVRTPNRAPSITNTPLATVAQGGFYRYDILAIDPDREPLFFDVVSGPVGLTVDTLGRVRWQTALTTPLGPREVTIRVRDGRGGADSRTFTINVVADITAPSVAVLIQPALIYPYSSPALVRITAGDDVGVVGLRVLLDGVPVALAADNSFSVPYSAQGNGRIQAFAVDAAGNEGRAVGRISMRTGLENDPNNNPGDPTASLALAEGATVGGFVRVIGTASSPDLERFTLSYRRQDRQAFTVLATGTTGVTNGVLGVWDTTLLENDGYVLRLEVLDLFGGSATVERTVGVSGEFKLGNFRLSFVDLTIPVAGLPLTVARTYDTLRSDRDGELGFGWRLEYRDTDLRTSLPRGELEGIGIYPAFRPGVRVFLTLPGGKREGFTFTPDIRVLPGFGGQGLTIATPRFTPDRGVTSQLSAGTGNLLVNEYGELFAPGGVPWNPASPDFSGYTLTTKDGLSYGINGAGQLTKARDRNGNTLTFSESGVTGPGGAAVTFERDARGRITSAIDPLGNKVRYTYSASGDLVTVTDRELNVSRFGYRTDRPHYLETVTDPLGRVGARAEYGPDGRLTGTFDAAGKGTAIIYDPANSLITTRDRVGNPTVTEYDSRGNIVAITDALGHTTRYTFDADNRPTSETDPLGRVDRVVYDSKGNPTIVTNALGHSIRSTYDGAGKLLSITDALGHTTTFGYDARGNPTRRVDPTGGVTTFTTDTRGLVLRATGPQGETANYSYNATGRLSAVTDASGSTVTVSADKAGNVTGEAQTFATRDGNLSTTWGYQFDRNGQLIGATGPNGQTSRTTLDAAGQGTRFSNPGQPDQTVGYSPTGEVTAVAGDGQVLNIERDADGRQTRLVMADGRVLRYEYDAAGREVAVWLPDGSVRRTQYDAAGQITGQSQGLTAEVREYDAGGRLTAITVASGLTTRYEYDAAGNRTRVTDGLGGDVRYEYDAANRLTAITDSVGRRATTTYDLSGNVTSTTDFLGEIRTFAYDSAGRRVSATDSLGQTTNFTYDGQGRWDGTTDALGRTTEYVFGVTGQLARRTLPLGQTERATYDAFARIVTRTDFSGRLTTYTYTADGRPATVTNEDGIRTYEYDSAGQLNAVTDNNGRTAIRLDESGRIVGWNAPHGGDTTFAYTLDGLPVQATAGTGATTRTTTRTFNPATRDFTAATDPFGGVTAYSMDPSGLTVGVQFPGGVTLARTLDTLGRPVTLKYSAPKGGVLLELAYQYAPNGRINRITQSNGPTSEYTYDDAGRLTVETTTLAGVTRISRYAYDAVGNLIRRTDPDGTITNFAADANDRLTSDGTWTYTYDANGNLSRRTSLFATEVYTYDARDRLVRFSRTGAGAFDVRYAYDADGLLAERQSANGLIRYVWDRSTSLPQLLEERDANGLLLRRYESNGAAVSQVIEADGTRRIFLTDAQGTPRAVTNAAGQIVGQATYDAYGRTTGGGLVGYTNGLADPETGLLFLRSRWYSAESARFLTMDHAPATQENPESVNRYAYVQGDPVNHTDPSGQVPTSLTELTVTIGITKAVLLSAGVFAIGAAVTSYRGAGIFPSFREMSKNLQTNKTGFGIGGNFINGVIGAEFVFVEPDQSINLFGVIGGQIGIGFDVPVSVYAFELYDTPKAASYQGAFWSFGLGPGLSLAIAIPNGITNPVMALTGTTIAWSPTPTTWGNGQGQFKSGAAPGFRVWYSHTIAATPTNIVSVGVSYYFLLMHYKATNSDIRFVPDFLSQGGEFTNGQLGKFLFG